MAYDFNNWASQYNLNDAQRASVQGILNNPDYQQRTRAYNLMYGADNADQQRAYDAASQLGILSQTLSGGGNTPSGGTSQNYGTWNVQNTQNPGSMGGSQWGTTGAPNLTNLNFGQANPNGATPGGAAGFGAIGGTGPQPYKLGVDPGYGNPIRSTQPVQGIQPLRSIGQIGATTPSTPPPQTLGSLSYPRADWSGSQGVGRGSRYFNQQGQYQQSF